MSISLRTIRILRECRISNWIENLFYTSSVNIARRHEVTLSGNRFQTSRGVNDDNKQENVEEIKDNYSLLKKIIWTWPLAILKEEKTIIVIITTEIYAFWCLHSKACSGVIPKSMHITLLRLSNSCDRVTDRFVIIKTTVVTSMVLSEVCLPTH